jgi:hypothetical protein
MLIASRQAGRKVLTLQKLPPVDMDGMRSADGQRIVKSLLSGANTINGFRNRDLQLRLANSSFLRSCGRCIRNQSAKI